jgi:hypothetical protein
VTYRDEESAALAHDRLERFYFGANAVLNFPRRRTKPASIEDIRAEARAALKLTTSSPYRGVYFRSAPNWTAWSAQIKRCTDLERWLIPPPGF